MQFSLCQASIKLIRTGLNILGFWRADTHRSWVSAVPWIPNILPRVLAFTVHTLLRSYVALLISISDRTVRLLLHTNVCEMIPSAHISVILDNHAVENRCDTIILRQGSMIYVPDSHLSVALDAV
jgi:hypothetical protein